MCTSTKVSHVLNLHCQNCGSENVVPTGKEYFVKSELGFACAVPIYQCSKCNEKFLICPECEGTGVVSKQLDYADFNDCETCYGMGLVELSKIKES